LRLHFLAVVVALIGAGMGCRTEGLAFRADERIEIVSPRDRSTVKLPVDLRWTVEDFRATGRDGSDTTDSGYFGVFLDTSPIPPGETLDYVARGDVSCRKSAGCPDERYLAERGIRTTTATSMRLETLRDNRPIDRPSAPDDHEITIVLLNGQGERIGESAFKVEFRLDRGN
jgi:hypothetical protein